MTPRTRNVLRRVGESPATYPLSTFWAGSMVVLVAMAYGLIALPAGASALAFLALVLILVAAMRNIEQVHVLVNSQHGDLVDRVQQLTDALVASNTEVPREPDK